MNPFPLCLSKEENKKELISVQSGGLDFFSSEIFLENHVV